MTIQSQFPAALSAITAARNKGRTILFETLYGSRLYGTEMPGSDIDIRGVYLPGLYDFLRETQPEVCSLDPDGDFPTTDDNMYFPVGTFIDQVIRMKVNAVEIFFAALQARREGASFHPAMEAILDHQGVLVSANPDGFIGHARQRAAAYIEKDDPHNKTLQANKHAQACLEAAAASSLEAPGQQICDIDGLVERISEHPAIERDKNSDGQDVLILHARQLPETERIAVALAVIEKRIQRFRRKAFDAAPEKMFKDLATSLRMMETVRDLMRDGEIRFPLPRATHYRSIRRGEISRTEILAEIDAAQAETADIVASGASPLRPKYEQNDYGEPRDALIAQIRYLALRDLPR